jgi:co-chaperonin GroES (HSP10)
LEVGDRVIFNEYDIKYVGSKENMFGIVKDTSIMAVYEAEKTEG